MHVIETVPRTGIERMIDPSLADGIIHNAESSGYKIIRTWTATTFEVLIMWPHRARPMLRYTAPVA